MSPPEMAVSDETEGRGATLAQLRLLATGVHEASEPEATARLLERVTATGDPEKLRALLTEVGAQALLLEARAGVGRA